MNDQLKVSLHTIQNSNTNPYFAKHIDTRRVFDEVVMQVQRNIDEAACNAVAGELAELGYVKVVRCRDCDHMHMLKGEPVCFENSTFYRQTDPDGYCHRAAGRKA